MGEAEIRTCELGQLQTNQPETRSEGTPNAARAKTWRAGARGEARRQGRGAQAQEAEEGTAQGTLVPEERREALPVVLDVGEPVAVVPVRGAEPI